LEIKLAKTAGFCFGVNNAIKTVFDLLEHADKKIYTLGPIIHNRSMVDYLKTLGITPAGNIDEIQPPAYVVIRAHGIGKRVYDEIEKRGFTIVDATCPFVKKIHNLVRDKYNEGYTIIIAGDNEHPEVKGINGWCDDQAIVINSVDELSSLPISDKKVFASAQTTFSYENWLSIVEVLASKFKNVETCNTICSATTERQKEAEELSKEADAMLVIGGKESSNTQKLFEICKKKCERTYKIETTGELPILNTKELNKVGVIAGASTPDWIIKEVLSKMDSMNRTQNEESFEEVFEDSIVTLKVGDIVKGKVISVGESEIFVDLGYKSDGIIPLEEGPNSQEVKAEEIYTPGMEVEVFVEKLNDGEGNVLLSKKKVDYIRGWEMIENAYNTGHPVEAVVSEVVNGGIIALINGIKIFIPASQVSDRYVKDLSKFLEQKVNIRIMELNKNKNRIIGSQRILLEEEKERLANELWNSIEQGKKYTGKVINLTKFGAFVDIGGVDGLIHISELSWHKIKHPSEVLSIGEEVEVTVLEYDKEKGKISLGYRKLEDNPWNKAASKYQVGDIIEGTIVRLVPFGCFMEIEKGLDGLVHISQISNKRIAKPDDVLKVGQRVEAKIIEMDSDNKKIGLSIKEVNPIDPIEENMEGDEAVKENETVAAEEIPTEHKEELSVTLGEVLGKININGNANDAK
jgi:ribosomal protein S1/(E)-4-hydroxy-3-methyl-but-2-enyl pyrophosphate reductase